MLMHNFVVHGFLEETASRDMNDKAYQRQENCP